MNKKRKRVSSKNTRKPLSQQHILTLQYLAVSLGQMWMFLRVMQTCFQGDALDTGFIRSFEDTYARLGHEVVLVMEKYGIEKPAQDVAFVPAPVEKNGLYEHIKSWSGGIHRAIKTLPGGMLKTA